MFQRMMNLQLFAGEGEGGEGSTGSQNKAGATYTYEQAEEIASVRAQRAERSALADFYRKQGLSEDEVTEAISTFKKERANRTPDAAKITKERDDALSELAGLKNEKVLSAKGVRSEDMDYVMFKVSKLVDDKTDFDKAADKFLKDNPRYAGKGSYKVSMSTGSDTDSSGSKNASINDRLRAAMRR